MIKEPIVRKAHASSNDVGLRLDLGVEGHCCIIDTDTLTYKHHTPEAVQRAVEDRRGHSTPFVDSVNGLLHKEAHHFVRTRLLFATLRSASLCLRGS